MIITWLGQSCFAIKAQNSKIVTDPYGGHIGFELKNDLTADIVTVSHQHPDHNNVVDVGGDPVIIYKTGTTTAREIEFIGVKTFHDDEGGVKRGENTAFSFSVEGVKIVHLGDLGHVLSQVQASELGNADILMIPVGGVYTIDAAAALEVVRQINPKIIIPMHYKIENLVFELATVDDFLVSSSLKSEVLDMLEISRELLPAEPKIVVLNKS